MIYEFINANLRCGQKAGMSCLLVQAILGLQSPPSMGLLLNDYKPDIALQAWHKVYIHFKI